MVAVPVIRPALNSPLAPRATIAPAVFALVAVEPSVTDPVDTLAVMPPPLVNAVTPVLLTVSAPVVALTLIAVPAVTLVTPECV